MYDLAFITSITNVITVGIAVAGLLTAMFVRARRAARRAHAGEERYRVRWGRKEETWQRQQRSSNS